MIVGLDPMLVDIDFGVVLIVILKTVIVFGGLLTATALMIWFERKIVGDLQNRIGPNRAGPFGLLQTVADGVKVMFKEDLLPDAADRRVFTYAPLLSVIPAFLTFAIVPVAGDFSGGKDGLVEIFGHTTRLQLADPPIGILLMLAMSSMAVYGIMLAGWSSGSKYPLIGSVRASAQMVSYEAALGLSVVAVVLVAGTLTTSGIVDGQATWSWNLWVTGIVPFVVFLIAGTAELNRPPFDLVEAEQELVGGYHTEYSGVKFAAYYLAEFMNTITMSAIIVTLFLGGPSGPVLIGPGWLWGLIWFMLKLVVFLYTFVWFRATLPRFRYDQLMDLGWKALIPLSLGWLLLLVALRVGDNEGWNLVVVGAASIAALLVGYLLLLLAFRAARRNVDLAEVLD